LKLILSSFSEPPGSKATRVDFESSELYKNHDSRVLKVLKLQVIGYNGLPPAMYTVYQFADDLRLATNNTGLRQLYRGTTLVKRLRPKELHVLQVLLSEPGKLHTRTEILKTVWGSTERDDGVVTNAASKLRKKALKPEQENLIEVIPGNVRAGREGAYRYAGTVERSEIGVLPTRSTKNHPWAIQAIAQRRNLGRFEHQSSVEKTVTASQGRSPSLEAGNEIKLDVQEPIGDLVGSRPLSLQTTIKETRKSLRRINFYAGIALAAALVFSVLVVVRRSREIHGQPIQIQRVVRQSREILSPIVTDGTQLYFPECVSGRLRLGHVNAQAVEAESIPVVTSLENPDLSDISPDGNFLLVRDVRRFVTASSQFYEQPTDGRAAIRLGNIRGLDGTWSRDQNHIYFGDEDKIYLAEKDGSTPRIFLDHLKGRPFWLRWSPDGKTLRFSLIQGHRNTIWEITLADQRPRQLPLEKDGGDFWCCGNWDNTGKLYFYQTRINNAYQIWTRTESSGKLMPFEQPLEDYRGPVPARSGQILYARSETQGTELERYDSMSHAIQPLLPNASISTAAVSPDGEWIAYSTFPIRALYVSRRDESQKRTLTDPSMGAVLPVWSPDGTRIAFMTRVHGWWEVYTVSAQGGDAKPLLQANQNETRDPSWSSSDSTQMLIGYGPVGGKPNSAALYRVDVASGSLGNPIPGSEGLFSPRWSPNGEYIAALSEDATQLLLYKLDNPKEGWRVVIRDAKLGYPNWSNDSTVLYVLDTTGIKNEIKRIRLPDLRIDTYFNFGEVHQPCALFGTWIGIDRDAPLFIKDTGRRLIGAFKYTTN
jgi:Tol biopolymer transport system component/DNA-binding winged helix-turn-helix (wHTH) protein